VLLIEVLTISHKRHKLYSTKRNGGYQLWNF
jgi:hypothetical protein